MRRNIPAGRHIFNVFAAGAANPDFAHVAAGVVPAQTAATPKVPVEEVMPKLIAAAALLAVLSGPASAEVGCAPNCDFTHYYGPYDYTWVRPGLYLYPRCGPTGDCSPYVISSSHYRGRVTIHRFAQPVRRQPQ
jgi:hypothetical protein